MDFGRTMYVNNNPDNLNPCEMSMHLSDPPDYLNSEAKWAE